ncbi:glycine oxidase ThiO [Oleisolibacter albus]|uniref:glycine oxidase ThiO n=1 Tax=Oleisolibacter albus TaxID=2171757 RepID=UPI000DF379F0|nr:glycine oxidase ThiO [Oleisolibacter albus]
MSLSESTPVSRPSVAVIGAGIIGLSIGWRLAEAGCRVAVYEQGRAGHGASRAAAGMLAANVEVEPGEEPLVPLCRDSASLWPGFAAALEAASGLPVELRREGTMVVALTRDDVEMLRNTYGFQAGQGLPLTWLTGAQAKEREPFLNPRTAAAVWSPEDIQVNNRAVMAALRVALTRAGGTLHEQAKVDAVLVEAGRARGLVVGGREIATDVVVLAAGAWSKLVGGLPAAAVPPVRPVKGQMLSVAMDPARPLLRHVVWGPKGYLVPRLDGTLIIGGTTEEKGWDDQLTAGGMLALLDAAWRVLPGVEELPVTETWCGFRPGCRDDAPVLGPVSAVDGLVLATGHHRNGILLAPVTAETIVDLVLSGRVDPRIAGFGLDRFAKAVAA